MRQGLVIGIVGSLLFNLALIFSGMLFRPHKAAIAKQDTPTIAVEPLPPIEEEKPETPPEAEEQAQPVDVAPPSLTDVPTVAPVDAFVQPVEPPPPPDLNKNAPTMIIPPIRSAGGAKMGDIFDINNLDQIPQARVRTPPVYPFEMRRAGVKGEVLVEFIVDTEGNVLNAYAVSSSQREFEAAAIQAVTKWKFRPGKKGGRSVNTRMRVPIVFNIQDEG